MPERRGHYENWLDRHPLVGKRLLFVRIVYFGLIPAVTLVGIATGDYFWAPLLAVVAVASLARAPKDRRYRILGRGA